MFIYIVEIVNIFVCMCIYPQVQYEVCVTNQWGTNPYAGEKTEDSALFHFTLRMRVMHTHSGNIEGIFREHSGNIQGTFRASLFGTLYLRGLI
jgi:hypothetical protein